MTLEEWAPIQDGEVITLEDWALIRGLHVSEKLPKAQIARQLGICRNTVARAVDSTDPPPYSRPAATTSFAPFEQQVRQLLVGTPSIPATVLAERVGWAGSPSWFRQNVALIRPDYAPPDPADRIVYHPGDQVQCDLWFPEPKIPLSDGAVMMLPVLVMVASFSKFITALMIPSRTTADLLSGMWSLLAPRRGHGAVGQEDLDQGQGACLVAIGSTYGVPIPLVGRGEHPEALAWTSAVAPGSPPGLVLRTSR